MKAVLVVDVPDDFKFKKSFADITLFDGKHRMWKRIAKIRPLPKKQVEQKYDIASEYDQYYIDEYATGWNDCIDEILKEEEE